VLFRTLWERAGINTLPVRRFVRGPLLKLLGKLPAGGTIAFYAGYPVFTCSQHAVPLSADEKLAGVDRDVERAGGNVRQ